jgi:hypothetical protein
MSSKTALMLAPDIERFIHTARSTRVILDTDLARLYGVPTKRLNEQFRRNLHRFPEDFAFQLTPEEWAALRLQIATVNIAGSSAPCWSPLHSLPNPKLASTSKKTPSATVSGKRTE